MQSSVQVRSHRSRVDAALFLPDEPPFVVTVLGAACALLLASCGGGGSAASDPVAAAGTTAQALATNSQADGSMSTSDTTWTPIASEGAHFTVSGTQTVRYGAGSSWVSRDIAGGADCSNTAFGGDPIYGTVKSCQAAATVTAASWSRIAGEGENFSVSGTQTVRYGTGSSWLVKTVTGSGSCSNAFFGSDPAYGVVKECDVDGSAATPTAWTKIANENAAFTLSGTQTVRYGSGASWITKTVAGGGTCSNGFFGNDPIYGVAKECDIASDGSSGGSSGGGSTPTAGVCTPPASPIDTSGAATVGNGTAASCTEGALRAAVGAYPIVRFNCGAAAVTIPLTATIDLPTERDTTIDGGNLVTLDGRNAVRLLSLDRQNYRVNARTVTLQHIALVNGKAPAGGYVAPNPTNPSCAYGYASGGGAAVAVRDAKLHAFDVDFRNNAAATPGPDIGGGAVYAMGSLDVLIADSKFSGNSGSNGGAVNMLNSNLRIYNSNFAGNIANGIDNYVAGTDVSSCPGVGGPGQGGAGGSGGAVSIDGGDDTDVTVCGSTFTGNSAVQAGALQRVADGAARAMTIDRSAFSGNTAKQSGAIYLQNLAPLTIVASTFSGNQAVYNGVGQLYGNAFNIVNSTFANNTATHGVAGALMLGNSAASSSIRNVTFAGNKASGGPGYFSAAIFGDTNIQIANTLFANNTSDDPWNPMQCGFTPAGGSNDLQWPRIRSVGGLTDSPCVAGIAFADPLLGALANNGGPTATFAPAAASPLRGAGRDCPTTDQRGNARSTANCTIGAVE